MYRYLKGEYALDQLNTSSRSVVEAPLGTSILTLMVSWRLHTAAQEQMKGGDQGRYTPNRWARAFREQSGRILDTLMDRLHRGWASPGPHLEIARTLMDRLRAQPERRSGRIHRGTLGISDHA